MAKPQKTKTQTTSPPPKTPPGDETLKTAEVIYNERKELLLGDLISKIESEGIEVAVAVIIDPKIQNQPIMYAHGATYNLAKVSCQIAKYFKTQIDDELTV